MNSELLTVDSIIEEHKKLAGKTSVLENNSWKAIEIGNWNFSYGTSEKKHTLRNISMKLAKGEKIALIGESGSGKSTMASLMKGLYVPDNGTLVVDGRNEENLGILSKITTLIPQDPEIFENTLEYNVTFGIEAPAEHIAEAVRLARFDSVLARLPNGLATDIKEK